MIKRSIIFGLFLVLIYGCGADDNQHNERVLVSVGEGQLTIDQLNSAIPSSIQTKVMQEQINNFLQQWIEMELVYRDALRLGMENDEELVSELENAKREILVRNYLERKLAITERITEKEALDYYNENKESYALPDDEIRALHILVASADEANSAYRRIRNGEDFETVAKEVSSDYSENQRIDLGYFQKENIVPDVAASVFSYRVGSVTRPLQSEFGFHIFKILDKRQKGTVREFDEVKDQIIARLKSIRKNEKYRELIIELRNKTDINTNIDLLKKLYQDTTMLKLDHLMTDSK